ncbi:hypothetical protein WJX72_003394 [[Myrmecia] bisecta]|uniref:Exosome complex component RRP45 n=1 Tax=[Myrmecia] bisecta TaxID=41462 RepID=A0AAW1QAA1_9CHLO
MQRDADAAISNNEKAFIIKALQEEQRVDGRRPFDYRPLVFQFAADDSTATVQLGDTCVMAVVTGMLEAPFPDRPTEGSIRFFVELSPMASPAFEGGRKGEATVEVTRLVERGLRDTRAVDLEALCVLAGRKVWALRVDVAVLDHGGNLMDAVFLASMAALMAYRRPDVTIDAGRGGEQAQVTVHSAHVKEPLPLSIHHLPLAVTFALFQEGEVLAVDPDLKEEAGAAGRLTVVMNTHQEVCALHKVTGGGVSKEQLLRLLRIASVKVEELSGQLKAALETHETAHVAARVRRSRPTALATPPGRNIAVLASNEAIGRKPLKTEAASVLNSAQAEIDMLEAAAAASESSQGASSSGVSSEQDGVEDNAAGSMEAREECIKETPGSGHMEQSAWPAAAGAAQSEGPGAQAAQKRTVRNEVSEAVDELEQLAAIIAGAGNRGTGDRIGGTPALEDALKQPPTQKGKRPKHMG